MAIVIANITVAQAATIINAIITFLQYSLGLALVALLLYFLPPLNSANSWSVAARQVHTSLWATVLRSGRTHASTRVNFFSTLSLITALLVALCGIVTPLGLKEGPPVRSNFHSVDASFVPDSSPLGLATSPRQEFKYSRICGGFSPVICPGNTAETINRTEIPPSVYETFTSTPYGPFDMQYRRYFTSTAGYNFTVSKGQFGLVQSMILREGIFGAEGVIVDMGDSPGIGLLNHTIPSLKEGATWSQDTLWLEPVTTCVNTNLTVDYILQDEYSINQFNLTDRGGFSNLTTVYPTMSLDGQNINLYEHAYKGAVLSNFYTMMGFNNMTRNESYVGKPYPLNRTSTFFRAGDMSSISLKFLSNTTTTSGPEVSCQGFGGADNANISNVGVQCGMFASPARRTDGGDPRLPSINSTWQQNLHVCASATRASIQTMTFSINTTKELSNLQITRKPSTTPSLWAVEKTDLKINDVDLFWGRVADKYESDPSLWTIRSTGLYVPAGGADIWGVAASGQPSTIPAVVWDKVYDTSNSLPYNGEDNYALLTKWQSLLAKDPELGHAQIRNMIWTDMVANNLVGSDSHSTLAVASLGPSVTYDLKYGIPLLLLFLIWAPSFIGSAIVLLFGMLRISRIRDLLNHTAVGRLAVGHSALVAAERIAHPDSEPIHPNEDGWRKTVGQTNVSFRPVINLQRSGSDQEVLYNELPKTPGF